MEPIVGAHDTICNSLKECVTRMALEHTRDSVAFGLPCASSDGIEQRAFMHQLLLRTVRAHPRPGSGSIVERARSP